MASGLPGGILPAVFALEAASNNKEAKIAVGISLNKFMAVSSTNLDRVIQELAVNFLEPMWRVVRNDDHLAL